MDFKYKAGKNQKDWREVFLIDFWSSFILLNCMIFSKPHFIKGNKDIGAKAQDKKNVGNDKGNHEMMTCIPDKPRS